MIAVVDTPDANQQDELTENSSKGGGISLSDGEYDMEKVMNDPLLG